MKYKKLILIGTVLHASALASPPKLNVETDCKESRRLDQKYTDSKGKTVFGSMQNIGPVDEDTGFCYAVTASYLADAWLRTYSPYAVKTNFRTSALDLALMATKKQSPDQERDDAVNGSGYSSGFSFMGGDHAFALQCAINDGVCARENVITETKTFEPGKQNWVVRTVAAYYETDQSANACKISDFLGANSMADKGLIPSIPALIHAIDEDNPSDFYRETLAKKCTDPKNRLKLNFTRPTPMTIDYAEGKPPLSKTVYNLLKRDDKAAQPVAMSLCLNTLMYGKRDYEFKKHPDLAGCRHHSTTVMGYCTKPDGKKAFLIREILGKVDPLYSRRDNSSVPDQPGHYSDGYNSGNYWVDEDVFDQNARSITWLD